MIYLNNYMTQRKNLQTEIKTLVKGLEEHFNDVTLDAFDIMELIDADELDDTVSFDINVFSGLGWINNHHETMLIKELSDYAKREELPATFESNVNTNSMSTTCDVTVECEIKDFVKVASHFINLYKDGEGECNFNDICSESAWAIHQMSHDSEFGYYELADEDNDEPLNDRLEYFFSTCKHSHGMNVLDSIEFMENNEFIDEEFAKGITEATRQIKFKETLAA